MRNIVMLNKMTASQLAEVVNGLMPQLYSEDADIQRQAFASVVDFGIWEAHSPLNVFEQIFDRLSTSGKSLFRAALGIALCQVRSDAYPAMGARDLIYLVGYTEAFQSLSAISSVLADNSNWDEIEPELYFNALAVLKGMGKSPLAYEACRKLITTQRFPERFLFDAYEALVLGKPAAWAEDLLWLSPRLLHIRHWQPKTLKGSTHSWFEKRLQTVAKDVVGKLSLNTICVGLLKLEETASSLDRNAPVGCLLIELLKPGGSCQLVVAESGATQLGLRDSFIRENWPVPLYAIDTFLWTVGIVPEVYQVKPEASLQNSLDRLSDQDPETAAQLAWVFSREEHQDPRERVVVPPDELISRNWVKQRLSTGVQYNGLSGEVLR